MSSSWWNEVFFIPSTLPSIPPSIMDGCSQLPPFAALRKHRRKATRSMSRNMIMDGCNQLPPFVALRRHRKRAMKSRSRNRTMDGCSQLLPLLRWGGVVEEPRGVGVETEQWMDVANCLLLPRWGGDAEEPWGARAEAETREAAGVVAISYEILDLSLVCVH